MTDYRNPLGDEVDTRHVLARMLADQQRPDIYADEVAELQRQQTPPERWFPRALRGLASYLPTDDRESNRRGPDEPWASWWARTNLDSGGATAVSGMLKGALGTTANWLAGKPEVGPDTLAPFGAAAMGVPAMRAAALARPTPASAARHEPPPAYYQAPRSDAGYSLSRNLAEPGDGTIWYSIFKDGNPIGELVGEASGPTIRISGINVEGGPGGLGVAGLRALREQIRSDFPEVNTFQSGPGERIAGVRSEWDGPTKGGRDQVVKFKADNELASLPGLLANAGERNTLADRLADVPQVPRREVLPSDFEIMRKPHGGGEQWIAHEPGQNPLAHAAPHVWAAFDPKREQLRIGESFVPEAQRGTGQGVAMYQRLIDEAHRVGYEVRSDAQVSKDAQHIYKALADRGYEVRERPGVTRRGNDTAEASGPVYTVWPRADRLFADNEASLPGLLANAGEQGKPRIVRGDKPGMNGETFYFAYDNAGQEIGRLRVHPDNSVGNVTVDPALRRQGIASALHDFAAQDRGVPKLGRGSFETPEGKAFLDSYGRFPGLLANSGEQGKPRPRAPESPLQPGTRDHTGAYFLEGDKPVYVNAFREGLDGLFGAEYAKGFDKFEHIQVKTDRGRYTVWYKPGERWRAEKLAEIAQTKPGTHAGAPREVIDDLLWGSSVYRAPGLANILAGDQ